MHRYLAFAWPTASGTAREQAAAWRLALRGTPRWARAWASPGLEVWVARDQRTPVRTLGRSGAVVIGDIFPAHGGAAADRTVLPDLPADPLDAARRLGRSAWGAYVALLPAPGTGETWVFRDPSAMLEALTWRLGEIRAVSDDVVHLPSGFAPPALALDWDVITEMVRRPMAAAHLSPLAGLIPVAPGDVQPAGGDRAQAVAIWRPSRWVNAPSDAGPEALRAAVLNTISDLASVEDRIVLEVSGGLDSAIVAASLVATGHRDRIVAALNYRGVRPEADERAWAEAACAHLGLPLTPIAKPIGEVTAEDMGELARCAAPAFLAVDSPRDRNGALQAERFRATATFGGQGGDAVFFQMPTVLVVSDFLRARGLGAWRDPFVADVARWLRRPVWSVLAQALDPTAHAPTRRSSEPFWGPRARAPGAAPQHPWIADMAALPPAKRVQIEAIMTMQAVWDRSRRGSAARIVHPLLAQPVLELCLSIPAWRLVEGGRDRALARRAFADLLPPRVTTRRSKGALTSDYTKRVAASLPFLREHLVDGVLARAGVLDGAAVAAALQPDQLIWTAAGAQLTRAALVESWVRHWQTRVRDLPSAAR